MKHFEIFINGYTDGKDFDNTFCRKSKNITDQDALIILGSSMKAIITNSKENIDKETVFKLIRS